MTDITMNKEQLVNLLDRIEDDINADIFFDFEDYPGEEYLGEYISDLFAAVKELRLLAGLLPTVEQWNGTEGQDRDNYTDDQDREFYTVD